jgi:hypothetical protein
MDGLKRLLDFLSLLQDKGITYNIEHYAPDSLTVYFTLVGARVEAIFDVDRMSFSCFKGREWVETDLSVLDSIFVDHWDDKPDK